MLFLEWPEMGRNGQNNYKWQETAGNGWLWPKIAGMEIVGDG